MGGRGHFGISGRSVSDSAAIRATNGFAELARRSASLAPAFQQLADEFQQAGRRGLLTLRTAQAILLEAARLLVADADAWRDHLPARKIERGA
jgi:hypothetical protein